MKHIFFYLSLFIFLSQIWDLHPPSSSFLSLLGISSPHLFFNSTNLTSSFFSGSARCGVLSVHLLSGGARQYSSPVSDRLLGGRRLAVQSLFFSSAVLSPLCSPEVQASLCSSTVQAPHWFTVAATSQHPHTQTSPTQVFLMPLVFTY